ncbi:hypothetical protein [Clostridium tarantellae]|nr:hypothetical protein [Clostridium tarantellae]
MEGIVIGGNIRCFLKLVGTKFIPTFKNKILFLESLSGNAARIKSYLTQYKNMGVFNEVNGVILGTFKEMEINKYNLTVEELVLDIINNENLPIVKTKNIGHGNDSKCLVLGKKIILES